MLISHRAHNNTIHVYSVTVMTHVIALEDGQSSQGISEPITPVMVDVIKSTTQGVIDRTIGAVYFSPD